ncbi:MAG: T9SS type A sorting domain-containing protein [Flavobacteriales bacterium]|nr:T9SS type A sorting domain-containing protein [Flavobacteriales bacterium]
MQKLFFSTCAMLVASAAVNAQTVTDIDGNVYPTVTIGAQVWMAANLKTTHYQNGDLIPNVTSSLIWQNLTTGARCYYADDSLTNAPVHGALYNWYAASDARNICPDGWRVPTDSDWNIMAVTLDATVDTLDNGSYTGTDIGGQLKEVGSVHWNAPNAGATNSSGFTALPGGQRFGTTFDYMGTDGFWWTSSLGNTATHAWYRRLSYALVWIQRITYFKIDGMSCRCVQELTTGVRDMPSDEEGFRVYPVPTTDRLNITGVGSAVRNMRVFDPLGRCVLDLPVNSGSISADVRELPPGIYGVMLSGPSVKVRRSFVKE